MGADENNVPGTERQGVAVYYESKSRELDVVITTKEANLRRLEAQRNELNGRVRALRDEVQRQWFFFSKKRKKKEKKGKKEKNQD
jgi:26S proteasome regulatory subunit T6